MFPPPLAQSSAGTFAGIVDRLDSDALTAVTILCVIGLTAAAIAIPAIVGHFWVTWERHRRAAELTRDLLASGFGPEQIRDALAAAFPADPPAGPARS